MILWSSGLPSILWHNIPVITNYSVYVIVLLVASICAQQYFSGFTTYNMPPCQPPLLSSHSTLVPLLIPMLRYQLSTKSRAIYTHSILFHTLHFQLPLLPYPFHLRLILPPLLWFPFLPAPVRILMLSNEHLNLLSLFILLLASFSFSSQTIWHRLLKKKKR